MRRVGRLVALGVLSIAASLSARTLRVGSSSPYPSPSKASAATQDGDTVLIDPGQYSDGAVWAKNNLVLRGVGAVHLRDVLTKGKGIWVIDGNNTTIEGIEFSDVTSTADKNGAGIRMEGRNLTIRNCWFHDCDDGILSGHDTSSSIVIEHSRFEHNGFGDGYSHNMYIGVCKSFTLQGCYVHAANAGHNVKSRAIYTAILYNRIMDEDTLGEATLVDIPNGGTAVLVGNLIERGVKSSSSSGNHTLIGWGLEVGSQPANPGSSLTLVNNTIVNDMTMNGTFLQFLAAHLPDSLMMANNLFAGPGTLITPPGLPHVDTTHDIRSANVAGAGLSDFRAYDYHLTPSSPCVGAGTSLPAFVMANIPAFEYVYPDGTSPRPPRSVLDAGAYAFAGQTGMSSAIHASSLPVLNVYPNPVSTTSVVTLIGSSRIANVAVFNMSGSVIALGTRSARDGEYLIDCSALPAGTYYAGTVTGAVREFVRFVVVR